MDVIIRKGRMIRVVGYCVKCNRPLTQVYTVQRYSDKHPEVTPLGRKCAKKIEQRYYDELAAIQATGKGVAGDDVITHCLAPNLSLGRFGL